jgi:hypothetical protein
VSETDDVQSIKRLEACSKIIEGLRTNYPDAKKFNVEISFEWQEDSSVINSCESELCPVVKIEVER